MKQCPQCRQSYSDDNLFCHDDGSSLEFVQTAKDQPFSGDIPTVVMSNYPTSTSSQPVPRPSQSNWTYPVIGVLAGLVVISGFLALFKLNPGEKTSENATVKETTNKETPVPTSVVTPVQAAVQPRTPSQTLNTSLPGRFPEGSARLLSTNDLSGKTAWDLRIMRNEIFARYGYVFKNAELRNYFLSQPWYRPQFASVDNFLNDVEKRNVMFLKSYE